MTNLELPVPEARTRLRQIIREQSVRRGEFVLASGERSDVYLDLRLTTTHPEGAFLVAHLFLDRVRDLGLDAVGGPTLGADPILGAMAAVSHLHGRPLRTFIVRKDRKAHGTRREIEGHLETGWRVLILDDVVTRAGSILHGIEAARAAGASVDRALTIVDRGQGGRERLAGVGVTLDAIFEMREILDDR